MNKQISVITYKDATSGNMHTETFEDQAKAMERYEELTRSTDYINVKLEV